MSNKGCQFIKGDGNLKSYTRKTYDILKDYFFVISLIGKR